MSHLTMVIKCCIIKYGNVNYQFVFLNDNFRSNGMIYFSLKIVHVINIGSF
jgi:hypothetical protein